MARSETPDAAYNMTSLRCAFVGLKGGRPGFDSVGSIFCRKTSGVEFRQKEKNLRVRGRAVIW